MSEQSESINELAGALAKAQGKITGALKDSSNPFFKSKYADLASCWDACREALSEVGLSVIQTTQRGEPVIIKWDTGDVESGGELKSYSVDSHEIVISTMLLHSSGQWIRSHLPLIPRDITPQGIGSAITYGRRYGLTAIVGVAQVDDDGNAASGRDGAAAQRARDTHSPKGDAWKAQDTRKTTEYQKRIMDAVNDGRDVLEVWEEVTASGAEFTTAVWVKLPNPIRDLIKAERERRMVKSA